MSMPVDDPLDPNTVGRGGVPRDRWDRALLIPPGGGPRKPYTAISTLANQLNAFGKPLEEWRLVNAIKGVAMSRELTAIAGSSRYNTRIGEEDEGRNREEKAILLDLAERGMELSGAHQKRDWGQAFHRFAEERDPLGEPPEDLAGDLEAFHRTLDLLGVKILAVEVFIVCEALGAAGSFDYALFVPWRPGKVVIGDSKTGKLKPDQAAIQLAGYANSEIYDRDTDERIPFEDAFGMPADLEVGYIPHTPPMERTTELWPLDLTEGFAAAQLARDVHARNSAVRKQYGKRVWKPLDVQEIAEQRVLEAIDELGESNLEFEVLRARLRDLHKEFKHIWTDRLSTYGGAVLRRRREAA